MFTVKVKEKERKNHTKFFKNVDFPNIVTGILCIKIFNNNFHQYALKNIFSELLSNWNILLTNMCISKGR